MTRVEKEMITDALHSGQRGLAESYYRFSGARIKIINRLIRGGYLKRKEETLSRGTITTRLVATEKARLEIKL